MRHQLIPYYNEGNPRSAGAIGPVVIGRSQRGPGGQPAKVESYSDFVNLFGDTVPGGAGGDISRYGNFQSPMYGTYAAKAFLVSNVAPLTYVRVLGEQHPNNDSIQMRHRLLDTVAGKLTQTDPLPTPATVAHMDCLFLLVQVLVATMPILALVLSLQFGILITMQLLFLVGQCGEHLMDHLLD